MVSHSSFYFQFAKKKLLLGLTAGSNTAKDGQTVQKLAHALYRDFLTLHGHVFVLGLTFLIGQNMFLSPLNTNDGFYLF